MKKGIRLLILVGVAAVFAGGAWLLNQNTKQQEAAKKAAEQSAETVLLSSPADSVTKLSYTHGGDTLSFVKKDSAWVYEPRESFALNTTKMDDLLTAVKQVEAVRTVAENQESVDEYGLKTPAVVITLTDQDGKTQTLSMGDKNATNGNYYATAEGKPGVYMVSSDLYNAFDLSLMQLLTDEAYPTVETTAVTGVDWNNSAETHTLTYQPNGDASAYTSDFKWFDQGQDSSLTPVNADAVTALLSAATGVTYDSTAADTKDDLATYGLDQPGLSVTLRYTEDVPQSQADTARTEESAALATALPTASPTPSATPEATATPAATATGNAAGTATATPEATATASATAAAGATATASATVAAGATAAPIVQATAKGTVTPTVAPTATATPTAAASNHNAAYGSAVAEDASAVPTETATAEPTATPEPTVTVERTLTLWFGKTAEDGTVYMTHNKTNRIFKVKADTLTALQKLTGEDLKLPKPLYLTQSELTGLTATMGGVTKTITAQTTSETDKNGNLTAKTTYLLDGKDMETTQFTLFVNNLKAIKAESYTDTPVAAGTEPILQAVFTQNRAGFETITAAYYPYDANFDQAVVNGNATMLVNKRDVENLQTYFDGMVAVEPTATPEATVTATPVP